VINQPIVLQNADMLCTSKPTAWLLLALNATHKLLADSLICLQQHSKSVQFPPTHNFLQINECY